MVVVRRYFVASGNRLVGTVPTAWSTLGAALALLDLSQPHIEIVNITSLNDTTTRVLWRVNGCHTINEARARYFLPTSSEEETITFIKESDHKYPS